MMICNPGQVVVTPELHGGALAHNLSAYHRELPEVRGEGSSPTDAVLRLAQLLNRALDNVPHDWHRQIVEQAIADARAYAAMGN
jgi:hypothetical protein